jgi:hypothetical protein
MPPAPVRPQVPLAPVALAALVALAPSAVAEPLHELDLPLLEEAALQEARALPRAELVALRSKQVLRWGGGTFVQLEQTWNGLPVHGARIAAAYTPDGALRRLVGAPMSAAPPRTTPGIAAEQARTWAEEYAAVFKGEGSMWPSRSALGVLARKGQAPALVWVVDVSTSEPVGAWRVFVDAGDGEILGEQQQLFTAQGQVYGSNPLASELEEVTLPGVTSSLRNDYAWTSSCVDFDDQSWTCNEKRSWATPDSLGDFIFDPDPSSVEDPFAEVQMFWHLDRVARWFEDEFGFRTNFGVAGRAIEGIVNFQLQNAFFGDADGDGVPEVAFGQGGGVDYAYDADVVYHEFGHAVFGAVVDSGNGRWDEIGRLVAPSGLNEGSADFFSLAITGDPELGEYAGTAGFGNNDAIRNLDADRRCPDDIYGESHVDGELWGALGWNLIEDPTIGPDVAAQAVFGALNLWDDEVTFGAAGEALMEATDDLLDAGYITEAVHARMHEIIEDAGFADCGRVIRLDDGARPRQATFGANFQGNVRGFPMPNQYSLDAPEGTTSITFRIEDWLTSNAGLGYRLLVRRGAPIPFVRQGGGGGGGGFSAPEPTEFDFEQLGDGARRVLLDDRSDPPLEPGATYYFAVTSSPSSNMSGFAGAELEVSGETEFEPAIAPSDDDLDGSGCSGCASRLDGGAGSGALAFVLLLGVAVGRRRR